MIKKNCANVLFTLALISIYVQQIDSLPKPVFEISIPKSGTHLLVRLIELLNNTRFSKKALSFAPRLTQNELNDQKVNLIYSHAIFNQNNLKLFEQYKNKFAFIFIYRDPRDQIISMAHWIKKTKDPAYLASKSIEDLITLLITDMNNVFNYGKDGSIDYKILNNDINGFYNLYMPWAEIPGCYVTRFEKLVGPKGGGDLNEQYIEIKNIAQYMGIILEDIQVQKIAEKLFGQAGTFREGKIGAWKSKFTEVQKKLFKEVAGQLLIDLKYEKDLNW